MAEETIEKRADVAKNCQLRAAYYMLPTTVGYVGYLKEKNARLFVWIEIT